MNHKDESIKVDFLGPDGEPMELLPGEHPMVAWARLAIEQMGLKDDPEVADVFKHLKDIHEADEL
jgi:hypothetical protein